MARSGIPPRRLRTTETAYPESKLPLQPTGQNRSSLSRSHWREHDCLVSPRSLILPLPHPLPLPRSLSLTPPFSFPLIFHRHTSLSDVPAISPASQHPRLRRSPWYSGLINCVYTAVNSYRCLAPANWSSSRVLLLHTPATTTTHATGIPRFNSRGMISSSQPSPSCVPLAPAAASPLARTARSFLF